MSNEKPILPTVPRAEIPDGRWFTDDEYIAQWIRDHQPSSPDKGLAMEREAAVPGTAPASSLDDCNPWKQQAKSTQTEVAHEGKNLEPFGTHGDG